ncbi:RNA polymerase sigma factor [Chitinophaga defluvii]|uniref:Sigma-70 family RNA polymerase sigma factor n=1 Tax=Chitinophaga defluvii TaxID=3163343 RepID=A0ABV2TGL1_9BACT
MDVREQEDEIWWTSYREGDERSFERIYQLYYSQLANYGSKFTHDTGVIEEAVQDLFLKLWKNRDNIGTTPSVKHYLFKAFRRTLSRKLQKQDRFFLLPGNDNDLFFRFELSQEQLLLRHEHLLELKKQVDNILSTLTNRQREVIYLKFYEDLTYEEIADLLQMQVGGVYKLTYRALDRLREHMGLLSLWLLLFCGPAKHA